MNVQAEVSLYPLRTNEIGKAIKDFVAGLEGAGLTVYEGNMSSTVVGDVDDVFLTLGRAFKAAAADNQVVLVLKVSNACPSGGEKQGTKTYGD